MSALTWASTERFRTSKAQNVAIVFITIGTRYDLRVESAEHIAGVANVKCDQLSREEATPESFGYGEAYWLREEERSVAVEAMVLGNPLIVHSDSPSFFRFYRDVDRYASALGEGTERHM